MERLTIDEIIEHCDRKTRMYEKACDIKYLETTMNNSTKEYWEHKQVAEYLRKFKDYKGLEEQGKKVLARELSSIAEKHLIIRLKPEKEHNKVSQKQYEKFMDLLKVGESD